MSTNPAYGDITAEEFLDFKFPSDRRFELDNGVVVAMAGGTRRHAAVQGNILMALGQRLRGSGCRPYGPDMAIRTGDTGVRYPDVSIICSGPADSDEDKASSEPAVIVEVLSPSTAAHDQSIKLAEYRALPSVQTILFVDPADEQLRVVQRTGPRGWSDEVLADGADVELPSLGITLPRAEIFARD